MLKLIRPQKKSIFDIQNPGLKYIHQLRVGLSSLKAHKNAHNFIDTPENTCYCNTGIEDNIHYLLKCPRFTLHRQKLFDSVNPIISQFYDVTLLDDLAFVEILLYGNKNLTFADNHRILNATIFLYSILNDLLKALPNIYLSSSPITCGFYFRYHLVVVRMLFFFM